MGTGSFPGGKAAGAWCWPQPSHLQYRSLKKGRALPLPAIRVLIACKEKTRCRQDAVFINTQFTQTLYHVSNHLRLKQNEFHSPAPCLYLLIVHVCVFILFIVYILFMHWSVVFVCFFIAAFITWVYLCFSLLMKASNFLSICDLFY